MKKALLLILLAGCGSPEAPKPAGGWTEADGVWTCTDAPEPVPLEGVQGKPPLDIIRVEVTPETNGLTVTYTFQDDVESMLEVHQKKGNGVVGPIQIYLDHDLNRQTGGKSVSANLKGYERLVSIFLSTEIEFDDDGTEYITGFQGTYSVIELKDGEDEFDAFKRGIGTRDLQEQAEKHKATRDYFTIEGATVTVSLDYEDIGGEPDQSVRLLIGEFAGVVSKHTFLPEVTVIFR